VPMALYQSQRPQTIPSSNSIRPPPRVARKPGGPLTR
jgi:hypothetical protein